MILTVYQTQYEPQQILDAMSNETYMNAPAIAKKVGCSGYTVKRILEKLEHEGKVKFIEIETGNAENKMKAWIRI